jgi:hypothetical protein
VETVKQDKRCEVKKGERRGIMRDYESREDRRR